MQNIDIDRFSGEAQEPPLCGWCGYCGASINRGEKYFLHEGNAICEGCAKRYAYSVFERDAMQRTAKGDEKIDGN